MNIFKKELPWVGIALIVLSISTLILSIRLAIVSVQLKQIKTICKEYLITDNEITKDITTISKMEASILERIKDIEENSPTNCLREHRNLYKEYADLLIIVTKLTKRVEALETQKDKGVLTWK